MNDLLKPCPFCGGKATIVCCDDEGNIHDDDYENDPWNGLWYQIRHSHEENEGCPIARYAESSTAIGTYTYDTREEAIEAWNRRTNEPEINEQGILHGYWIGKPISGYADCKCSVCGAICNVHASAGIPTQRYGYRCGAKMLEDE